MRNLGQLAVSGLGYGCMGLSGIYGSSDDAEGIRTIHRAVDLGVSLFDTADIYGNGHNERLVGKALRDRRDRVRVATKFGLSGVSQAGGSMPVNGRPEYVKQAFQASLQRLGLDYIDLYYLHRVDPQVPIEDTVGAMAELVQAGQVGFLGLSEASAATLRRAHAIHPVTALQSEWSLWTRDIEGEILQTCRELGIGVVPWSPLGRGFLTNQLEKLESGDWRATTPRFQGDNFSLNRQRAQQLGARAESWGYSAAQVCLAWLLYQGEDVVPIPGTRSIQRLEENCASVRVHLSAEQLAELEALFPPGVAAGERYTPEMMRTVNL